MCVFRCFLLFFLFWVFLFSFFLFGPPHLALNPPYLFLVFVFFFVFVLFCFCLCVSFLCFLIQNNLVFPLEKGIFCLCLGVSLCFFSLAFFGLPLFQFLFLCLSLVIFFISSLLSLFLVSFDSLFFLSFFPFLSSLLFFHDRNNIKTFNCNFFFINMFSFSLVSCIFY